MKETVSILCVLVAAMVDVGNANYFSSFHDIKHLQLPHQGTYKVANFPVTVKVEIPHWLESGKYKAEIRISEGGQQMGCYEIDTKLN
ncbi:hypothetical protein B566_EDAN013179 [Ephemera danica]|nr:hypothetical protein B566_EDAN013179 [Ephemera danica]